MIHKFSFTLAMLAMLFLTNACTDEYAEINTNPKLVTDKVIKPGLLLTTVLKNSIFDIQNTGNVGELAGYTKNPASGQLLIIQNGSFGNYRSYIVNLNAIIRLTSTDESLSNENAIARIWKVYVFHRMTDMMGDIPYFEAAKSVNEVVTHIPYDTQEAIYKNMLSELKLAADQLVVSSAKATFGAADILFGSDINKWKMFANSLRFRLAMRVRYADASLSQTNITDVIGASLITTNAQNAAMKSEGTTAVDVNNWNPLFNTELSGNLNRSHPSFTVSDNLIKTNDPRLSIFISPSAKAGFRCSPINTSSDESPRYNTDSISLYSSVFRGAEYTFNIITSAEVSFLRAEAALFGITSEDANELYRRGIQLTMEQYKVTAGNINTFLASPVGTLSGTDEEKLEQIIVQKYLSIIMDPSEAWAEYRRTGYPRIWVGSLENDTNGQILRRFVYPEKEYLLNEAYVTEAAARYSKGDNIMSKVWWDVKPGLPFAHPKQGIFPPDVY